MWDDERQTELRPVMRVSGRVVVVSLFVFGIALTSLLWIYWNLHTAPFRPLQDALAAELPGSSPRVEGGQRKMHKGTPRTLRVTLRVDFDPIGETARGEQVLDRVEQIARRYVDLGSYEVLEVNLFQGVPEKELRENKFTRRLSPSPGR
jgi:hypothetical protein